MGHSSTQVTVDLLLWVADKDFTTDVGRCVCDWRMWSPHRQETVEAFQHHLEFVRRQHQATVQATKEREASLHTISGMKPKISRGVPGVSGNCQGNLWQRS